MFVVKQLSKQDYVKTKSTKSNYYAVKTNIKLNLKKKVDHQYIIVEVVILLIKL